MMNDSHTMLEEYRHADFNQRLNLYLQFPALRSKFMAIDQEEKKAEPILNNSRRRPSRAAHLNVLLSFPVGCLKKLIGIVQT